MSQNYRSDHPFLHKKHTTKKIKIKQKWESAYNVRNFLLNIIYIAKIRIVKKKYNCLCNYISVSTPTENSTQQQTAEASGLQKSLGGGAFQRKATLSAPRSSRQGPVPFSISCHPQSQQRFLNVHSKCFKKWFRSGAQGFALFRWDIVSSFCSASFQKITLR